MVLNNYINSIIKTIFFIILFCYNAIGQNYSIAINTIDSSIWQYQELKMLIEVKDNNDLQLPHREEPLFDVRGKVYLFIKSEFDKNFILRYTIPIELNYENITNDQNKEFFYPFVLDNYRVLPNNGSFFTVKLCATIEERDRVDSIWSNDVKVLFKEIDINNDAQVYLFQKSRYKRQIISREVDFCD